MHRIKTVSEEHMSLDGPLNIVLDMGGGGAWTQKLTSNYMHANVGDWKHKLMLISHVSAAYKFPANLYDNKM